MQSKTKIRETKDHDFVSPICFDDATMMVILGFDDIRRNRVGQIDDRHGLQDDAPGTGQLDVA